MGRRTAWSSVLVAAALLIAAPSASGATRCTGSTEVDLTWGRAGTSDYPPQPPVAGWVRASKASGLAQVEEIRRSRHRGRNRLVVCRSDGRPLTLLTLGRGEIAVGATRNADRIALRLVGGRDDRVVVVRVGRRGVLGRHEATTFPAAADDRPDGRMLLAPTGELAWVSSTVEGNQLSRLGLRGRAEQVGPRLPRVVDALQAIDGATVQPVGISSGIDPFSPSSATSRVLGPPVTIGPSRPGSCAKAQRARLLLNTAGHRVDEVVARRETDSSTFAGFTERIVRVCDLASGRTVAAVPGGRQDAANLHDSYTTAVQRVALAGDVLLIDRRNSSNSAGNCSRDTVSVFQLKTNTPLGEQSGVLAAPGDAPVPTEGGRSCSSGTDQDQPQPAAAVVANGAAAWFTLTETVVPGGAAALRVIDAAGVREVDTLSGNGSDGRSAGTRLTDLAVAPGTVSWRRDGTAVTSSLAPRADVALGPRSG